MNTIIYLFQSLLCYYGYHKWSYFRVAPSFEYLFPESPLINRRYKFCKRIECTNDGDHWSHRL